MNERPSSIMLEKEPQAIRAERFLETQRVLVMRKPKPGEENHPPILVASNHGESGDRIGKSPDKACKYEIPGGKTFDDKAAQTAFLAMSEPEKELSRLKKAGEELEEESGLYVHLNRFQKLYTTETAMTNGSFKKIPHIDHKRITFWLVILEPEEYENLPETWTALQHSDDSHEEISWEPSGPAILSDPETRELIASNSHLGAAQVEEALKRMEQVTEETRAKALAVANSGKPMTVKDINDSNSVQETNKIISPLDIISISPDFEAFKKIYETHFEVPLDVPEAIQAGGLMAMRCLPHIVSRTQFMRDYIKYDARALQAKVEKNLMPLIRKIQDPESFFEFAKKANQSPLGRRMLKSFVGFKKISKLPYYQFIDAHEKEFRQALRDKTEEEVTQGKKTGRRLIKGFTGGRKCYLKLDSNAKAIERMATKCTRKSEVDPSNIKDVYRASIIVANENDIREVINKLQIDFGRPNSPYDESWNLKVKESTSQNLTADSQRKEYKLLGSFPIKYGEEIIRIPVEIQIMTEEDYKKNESGANHHDVYVALQDLVDESRPTIPILESSMWNIVKDLANNPEIYRSYIDYEEGKKEQDFIERAKKDIKNRFKNSFFKGPKEEEFFAYQHVLRIRDISDIVPGEDEAFRLMAEALNARCEVILHAQDWKILFDEDKDLSDEIIFTRIGANVASLVDTLKAIKFEEDIDLTQMKIRLYDLLNKRCDVNFSHELWDKILVNPSKLEKPEKIKIKKNRKRLNTELANLHGFNMKNLKV